MKQIRQIPKLFDDLIAERRGFLDFLEGFLVGVSRGPFYQPQIRFNGCQVLRGNVVKIAAIRRRSSSRARNKKPVSCCCASWACLISVTFSCFMTTQGVPFV